MAQATAPGPDGPAPQALEVGPQDARWRALLVHGNDLAPEFYRPLAGELAGHGVATAILSLPGFAGQAPLARPSWDAYAGLVADELARRRAGVLIGHSMGGLMAALAAARRPAGLQRLVLLEPAIVAWRRLARAAARRYLRDVIHGDRSRFVNWTGGFPRVHDPDRFPRAMIDLYLQARAAAHLPTVEALFRSIGDLPLPLAEIDAPVLLLGGASTGWRGRLLAWLLRRRLTRVTYQRIAGAGHWMANEQDPVVAGRIAGFLAA